MTEDDRKVMEAICRGGGIGDAGKSAIRATLAEVERLRALIADLECEAAEGEPPRPDLDHVSGRLGAIMERLDHDLDRGRPRTAGAICYRSLAALRADLRDQAGPASRAPEAPEVVAEGEPPRLLQVQAEDTAAYWRGKYEARGEAMDALGAEVRWLRDRLEACCECACGGGDGR